MTPVVNPGAGGGGTGPQGPQGPRGLPTSVAAWLDTTAFVTGQGATRLGSAYLAVSNSTGVDPATDDGTHWQLLVAKGAKGDTGTGSSSVIKPSASYGGLTALHSNRAASNSANEFSDGTVSDQTFRWAYDLLWASRNVRVSFGNTSWGINPGLNNITVSAALELPSGAFVPLFFNGARQRVIEPGSAVILTDPSGIVLPAGRVYVRCRVVVAAGAKWPVDLFADTTRGDGRINGDSTLSGSIPQTSSAKGYSPLNVVGDPVDAPHPVVALVGDSICKGGNDSDPSRGYLQYALEGHGVGVIKEGHGSQQLVDLMNAGLPTGVLSPVSNSTHTILQYGVNDFRNGRTDTQLRADVLTFGNWLVELGVKPYLTTVTPDNSSGGLPTFEAGRRTHNDWRRTVPAPYLGVFDAADKAETARNSGLWKPTYSVDGLHPEPVAIPVLATAIDPAVFTV